MIPSVAQAQIRSQGPSSKREEEERAWERTCTNILQFYIYYNHYIILLWGISTEGPPCGLLINHYYYYFIYSL